MSGGGGSMQEDFKLRLCGSLEAVEEVCASIDELTEGEPHKPKAITMLPFQMRTRRG